ncbi:MAG: hypothetical protein U0S48_10395 [Solirubrobacteraceae bacterium]
MSTGLPLARVEAREKVTGAARYAVEHPFDAVAAHGWIVTSTVARGRIASIDTAAALAAPASIRRRSADNAPRLRTTPTTPSCSSTGGRTLRQAVGVVVAESPEAAREAAALVRVSTRRSATT